MSTLTLTKDDLLAISQLLDSRLDPIKSDITELKGDVRNLKDDVRNLKDDVRNLKDDVRNLKDDVRNLKGDVQTLFGKADVIENDIRTIKLTMENVIKPQLQLLAENYMPAEKRYEKATAQIENMQSDIEMLKKVTADHSERLQKIS